MTACFTTCSVLEWEAQREQIWSHGRVSVLGFGSALTEMQTVRGVLILSSQGKLQNQSFQQAPPKRPMLALERQSLLAGVGIMTVVHREQSRKLFSNKVVQSTQRIVRS